jgi:hypothetical protein
MSLDELHEKYGAYIAFGATVFERKRRLTESIQRQQYREAYDDAYEDDRVWELVHGKWATVAEEARRRGF